MTTRKMKKTLEYLGPAYEERTIDLEQVAYRELKGGYSIEVSGIARRGWSFFAVYVWGPHGIIETLPAKQSDTLATLKHTLEGLVKKYDK